MRRSDSPSSSKGRASDTFMLRFSVLERPPAIALLTLKTQTLFCPASGTEGHIICTDNRVHQKTTLRRRCTTVSSDTEGPVPYNVVPFDADDNQEKEKLLAVHSLISLYTATQQGDSSQVAKGQKGGEDDLKQLTH